MKRRSYVCVSLVFSFSFSPSFSFLKSRAFEVECEASNIVGVWRGVEGWGGG